MDLIKAENINKSKVGKWGIEKKQKEKQNFLRREISELGFWKRKNWLS